MDQAFDAVLFDRDGTLIRDVPYNGDPTRVTAVPGARELLRELRTHGLRTGVVSNQSGIGRGLLTEEQVGDIEADVGAAEAAGAVPVLVPTAVTRPEEVERAPRTAPDLRSVLEMIR
ncbi:MAG: HAD-IIIA family hydrolase [Saccharothrix sp.]|nr:HAD-IIIA family hydrolase [Saccharothrix sp.]